MSGRGRVVRARVVPFLLAVLAGVLIGAVALGVFLAVRANQNSELLRQDVEAAVALLLETQRTGDVRGYAQLLDPTAEVWRSRQIAELRQAAPPPAQVNVQSVRLQGDLALAELLETEAGSGETATRTAFFRQRDGQWLLTASLPEQFGPTAQVVTSHFLIEYRQRRRSADSWHWWIWSRDPTSRCAASCAAGPPSGRSRWCSATETATERPEEGLTVASPQLARHRRRRASWQRLPARVRARAGDAPDG